MTKRKKTTHYLLITTHYYCDTIHMRNATVLKKKNKQNIKCNLAYTNRRLGRNRWQCNAEAQSHYHDMISMAFQFCCGTILQVAHVTRGLFLNSYK